MADEPRKQNVLMFPFMAQGHIIPFLALALKMEKIKGDSHTITLINTPMNIEKLRQSLPSESSLNLLEISFESSDHGLPPNSENFDCLDYSNVIRLLEASISLKEPFRNILIEFMKNPVYVIGDFFMGWVGKICKELGIFCSIFSPAGAFGLACYRSIWVDLPHKKIDEEEEEFFLEDFPEPGKIHRTQLNLSMLEADGTDSWSVFQKNNIFGWSDFDGFLFNTVEEFDRTGLSYFRRTLNLPVWSIGPVLLSGEYRRKPATNTVDLMTWLDSKPENSVLYICFGSMNTISATHMMELAMALERSEKNFIWVVRPPIGFDINGAFRSEEWLPEGFEERMKESRKGVILEKWAPQVEILSHNATCAFMSHCGWNSILESLSHGVPMIGWPMAGEQFFNSKLLEEDIGVCVELARGKNCEMSYEKIVGKIKSVMDEKSEMGREMRKKAEEMKKMIKRAMEEEDEDRDLVKGSSIRGMEEFLQIAMLKIHKKQNIFMEFI